MVTMKTFHKRTSPDMYLTTPFSYLLMDQTLKNPNNVRLGTRLQVVSFIPRLWSDRSLPHKSRKEKRSYTANKASNPMTTSYYCVLTNSHTLSHTQSITINRTKQRLSAQNEKANLHFEILATREPSAIWHQKSKKSIRSNRSKTTVALSKARHALPITNHAFLSLSY